MSKELAADYFSRHQNDECHITSDNRVFHTLGSAQSFASGLKDTKVASYTRAEFETVNTEDSQDEEKESRFKSRVDRLIELGFERTDDVFVKDAISIDTTAVYEISDDEFEIGLKPLVIDNSDQSKVQALEALKNFDATTALYPEIKALFKDLGLDAPTLKQPDLLAAIEAYKTAINTEVKE